MSGTSNHGRATLLTTWLTERLLMEFSPQSQAVVDQLLSGAKIKSSTTEIGPLDETEKILLHLVHAHYDEFSRRSGDDRVSFLLTCYKDAKDTLRDEKTASEEEESMQTIDNGGTVTNAVEANA